VVALRTLDHALRTAPFRASSRYVATAAEASHDEVALIRAQGLPGARRRAKARAPKAPAPVRRAEASTSWQVAIPRGVAGLPGPSTAKCAEIYTLCKDDLAEAIGTLPRAYMSRVDAALGIALALPLSGESS